MARMSTVTNLTTNCRAWFQVVPFMPPTTAVTTITAVEITIPVV
jgi:hypothetical protein